MGGRWGCELTVSLKFAQTIIERYKNSRVGTGVANLHYPWDLQSPPYKDTIIQGWTLALQTVSMKFAQSTRQRYKNSRGAGWHYKLTVCVKFAQDIIQRYTNTRVDVGVTHLQCRWNLQSLPHTNTKIQEYKLTVRLKFAMSSIQRYKTQGSASITQRYKKLKGGRWRYKHTM